MAAASRQYDEQETDEGYRFVCRSPLNTTNCLCLYLPKSYRSARITCTDARGERVDHRLKVLEASTDTRAGRLFWLTFENSPEGITVSIEKEKR